MVQKKAWDLCEEYKLPRIIFVTNMDDDHASFRELILKLEKKFGRKIAPFQVPIRENEKFVGFVNAVKMQGRRFTNLSDYEDCEIPEYTKKNLGIIRDALIEAVAETSEEYMSVTSPAKSLHRMRFTPQYRPTYATVLLFRS